MGEKITNKATDKELISKMYKQLLYLNSRKINDTMVKQAKGLNKHFSKDDIWNANKRMKRSSTSLIIRKMQIKTIMRYHFMPVKMTALPNAIQRLKAISKLLLAFFTELEQKISQFVCRHRRPLKAKVILRKRNRHYREMQIKLQ